VVDVAEARDDVEDIERRIETYRRACERNQERARRQREYELREAEREAREYASSSSRIDFGSLLSDGKIDCFGGCRPNPVSPYGPYSTITSSKWGDKAPAGSNTSTRSAQ
jgi:hypothetical protein